MSRELLPGSGEIAGFQRGVLTRRQAIAAGLMSRARAAAGPCEAPAQ
jgi:hypothetical protein